MYIPVAAHRGNSAYYPENTMAAFASAYEIGADQIELDLHMTKDGEIIVMHDRDVSRTTDGHGIISSMTLKEVRALDAGIKRGEKFRGERVPTFAEFLELTKRDSRMTFNFELKDYIGQEGEEFAKTSAERSMRQIISAGLSGRCLINCFDGALLDYIDLTYNDSSAPKDKRTFRLHGYYPYAILGSTARHPRQFLYCACLFNQTLNDGKWTHGEGPVCPKAWYDELISDGVIPCAGADHVLPEQFREAVSYGAAWFTSNDAARSISILRELGLRNRSGK